MSAGAFEKDIGTVYNKKDINSDASVYKAFIFRMGDPYE